MKDKKRYSEAFKLKVMEELRDGKWKMVADAAQAYGVSAQGVRYWMKRLGFEHLNGRIIYVKTTSEIDEIKRLKAIEEAIWIYSHRRLHLDSLPFQFGSRDCTTFAHSCPLKPP